jgi:hypothetical protein
MRIAAAGPSAGNALCASVKRDIAAATLQKRVAAAEEARPLPCFEARHGPDEPETRKAPRFSALLNGAKKMVAAARNALLLMLTAKRPSAVTVHSARIADIRRSSDNNVII